MLVNPFCLARYDDHAFGQSKQRFEPFSPNRFGPWFHSGLMFQPKVGILLSTRYFAPGEGDGRHRQDGEHLVLLDERADLVLVARRLAVVVALCDELQLLAEDTPLRVDLVEVRLQPVERVAVDAAETVGDRRNATDPDLGVGHTGSVAAGGPAAAPGTLGVAAAPKPPTVITSTMSALRFRPFMAPPGAETVRSG